MKTDARNSCVAPWLAALAMLITGCGDGDTDEEPAGGGVEGLASGGAGGAEPVPTAPEDCPADRPLFDGQSPACLDESEAIDLCLAEAATLGNPTEDPSCGAGCTCPTCTQQMLDCGADPEGYCATILGCATEHGCTGVGCYTPETCADVIDAAPAGGVQSLSVALATEVSTCVEASTCASACP